MNEMQEKIALLEMQIHAMMREIRNLKSQLRDTQESRARDQRDINFFTALQADDDEEINDEYTAMARK